MPRTGPPSSSLPGMCWHLPTPPAKTRARTRDGLKDGTPPRQSSEMVIMGLGLGMSPTNVFKRSPKIRITPLRMQISRPPAQSGEMFVSYASVKGGKVILSLRKVRETLPVTRPCPELLKYFFSSPSSRDSPGYVYISALAHVVDTSIFIIRSLAIDQAQ